MTAREQLCKSLASFSNDVDRRLELARKQIAILEEEKIFWQRLAKYVEKEWHLSLVALIKGQPEYLTKRRETDNATIDDLGSLYQSSQAEAEKEFRRFPGKIEEAFRDVVPKIDRNSQHPRYYFGEGFFQLQVDDKRQTAKLSDNEGLLGEVSADPGAVVELVRQEYSRVFERPYEPRKVLSKLRHQYLSVLKRSDQPDGTVVPIRTITQRLGKNEKGFRTDEFLFDLSRLVNDNFTEIDGMKLDLQQTKDTNQGMLLHGLAGRGYVGFITFRKM
jgi:hypothetical protein